MDLEQFKNEVDLDGWTLKHDLNQWPSTYWDTKTVYFRPVSKGEHQPDGQLITFDMTEEETLCHELTHVHLGHGEVNMFSIGRNLESEVWTYIWARGLPSPAQDLKGFSSCNCTIDLIAQNLSPVELRLAYKWVGSCRHG